MISICFQWDFSLVFADFLDISRLRSVSRVFFQKNEIETRKSVSIASKGWLWDVDSARLCSITPTHKILLRVWNFRDFRKSRNFSDFAENAVWSGLGMGWSRRLVSGRAPRGPPRPKITSLCAKILFLYALHRYGRVTTSA